MCDFCEKIYTVEEAEEWKKKTTFWWSIEGLLHVIIAKVDNTYQLWNECDDYYYTGSVMEINYCPVCGRKL